MTEIIERPMNAEEKAERAEWQKQEPNFELQRAQELRRLGYQTISDPVFFKWQRGEATKEDWDAARAEVETLYPIPGE